MPELVGVWLHPCEREPFAFDELHERLADELSQDGVAEVVELELPGGASDSWLDIVVDCWGGAKALTVTTHSPRARDTSDRVEFGHLPSEERPRAVARAAANLAYAAWTGPGAAPQTGTPLQRETRLQLVVHAPTSR